jgi:hypothetical protein
MDGYKQVSSNLTQEETIKVFNELKAEGKADNIGVSDNMKAGDSIHSHIVQEIGGAKKSYVTDIETVVLSTSISFRDGTVAPTINKKDVVNSIKASRAKYLEQNTYKAGVNKVTMG